MGTVKMGRDFGLFAYDAIINDNSLLGAGSAFTAANPGHTTLGGLGFGYVYTDRLTQINWTSPKWGGFQATGGVFNPLDGLAAGGNQAIGESSLGYHVKGSFDWQGAAPGYVSATYLSQDIEVKTGGGTAIGDSKIEGWDVFGKIGFGGFGLAGCYFEGEGMSTLALRGLIFPGFSAAAVAEESNGYFVQGTYTSNNTKWVFTGPSVSKKS